jgi:hypothetical protein
MQRPKSNNLACTGECYRTQARRVDCGCTSEETPEYIALLIAGEIYLR